MKKHFMQLLSWFAIVSSLCMPNAVALGANTITFYHTDQVGTPLAMTSGSGTNKGTKVWEADYLPFGEEYTLAGSVANNRRFVGKEKDVETDLSNFGARYMDVKIGRFLAPDSVRAVDATSGKINIALLANPQRLNPYAYGLNNPYRFVDPDGNEIELAGSAEQQQYSLSQLSQFVRGGLSISKDGMLARTPSKNDGGIEKSIDTLIGSNYLFKVHATVDADTGPGAAHTVEFSSGLGANIYFDPNTIGTYQSGGLFTRSSRTPASELAHELLGRATQILEGIPNGRVGSRTRDFSNERAVDMANPAYLRMHMKPRTQYD